MTLHVISTGTQSLSTWLEITETIFPYADYLHIRERNWSDEKVAEAIKQSKQVGIPANKIIVNNRPTIVQQHRLGGVHLPESVTISGFAMSPYVKGSSVHSERMAKKKTEEGADYLFFGHVFETNSKPNLRARGTEQLKKTVEAASIPVIAIGGITPDRVQTCLLQGAKGIAVMSGIYEATDPVKAVQAFRSALKKEALHE